MCFGASVLLRKASALKRIDVRYGPQNASYFNFINLFPKSNINLILGNSLVVKTTKLISRTCIDTGFEPPYLLIYRGKVFIGSFGCRNDCLTVHFNCWKRRNAGFSPLELKLHSYSICCIIQICGEKVARTCGALPALFLRC